MWRDARGRIGTFAARDLGEGGASEKHLYLSREQGWAWPKADLVAFDLDGALPALRQGGELLLVEGLLDVLTLQMHGFGGVAAIGGNGRDMSRERLMALRNLGARRLIVCLDNAPRPDGSWPGREGSLAIARLASVKTTDNVRNGNVGDININVPVTDVIGCFCSVQAKTPMLMCARGIREFVELLKERQSAACFVGEWALQEVSHDSTPAQKRAGIERILEIDGQLAGPRAPLDREELRQLAAHRTGFSVESIGQIADELAREEEGKRRKRALESWLRDARRDVLGVGGDEVGSLLSRFSDDLFTLRARVKTAPAPFSLARLDEESARQPEGKVSGWSYLGSLGVRFGAGEFALVGARTEHGKTSFLVALPAQWLALEGEETLLFFSLEEPELRMYHRLLALLCAQEAARAGSKSSTWTVPQVRDLLRDPSSRGREFGWPDPNLLNRARERLRGHEKRLQIVLQSDWTLDNIESHAHLQDKTRPVGAVFVDYLQRVPTPSGRFDRRDQEVSALGRRLKTLAGDIGAPVLAGAQINREAIPEGFSKTMNAAKSYAEAQKVIRGARPELHHLREGGSEQEADLTLGLLSYGADYRDESPAPAATRMEVGTLKNRNGEPGKWVSLAFEGRSGLVREPLKEEDI